MIDFAGQVAVVTGAGRGLGRLYALELARRGASVVVNDLGGSMGGEGSDATVADAVVAEITAAGGVAVASHDSVDGPAGGEAIVRTAVDQFGRLDAVIRSECSRGGRGAYQCTRGHHARNRCAACVPGRCRSVRGFPTWPRRDWHFRD